MIKRLLDIIFFVFLAILLFFMVYIVSKIFDDRFYEDCTNCYNDDNKRHWNMDK